MSHTAAPAAVVLAVLVVMSFSGVRGDGTPAPPVPSGGDPPSSKPPCLVQDKRWTFTSCNAESGMMTSVEYFRSSCEETFDAFVDVPRDAPCVRNCPSGTFYSARTLACEKCEPGESSNSGGRLITDFSVFPNGFTTYCGPKPCVPWAAARGAAFLSSGNQTLGERTFERYGLSDESVAVSLVTIVSVVNPRGGLVSFLYRVESELYYDGLYVLLNGTRPHPEKFLGSGVQRSFREATFPLPYGDTEIQWIYEKDTNQNSFYGKNVGDDRAFIREITIEGVQMFAPSCTKCAAGRFSAAAGAMSCDVCPAGTFSTIGSNNCTTCPAGTTWSPPGAAYCRAKTPCTAKDYVAVYTPCQGGVRSRTWRPATDRCIPNEAARPPAASGVPCATCMPGFSRSTTTDRCEACPIGTALVAGSQPAMCASCAAGSAAIPRIVFDAPDGFAEDVTGYFRSSCDGLCQACPANETWCTTTNGFFQAPVAVGGSDDDNTIVALRTHLDNGDEYTAKLTYTFMAVSSGAIAMRYFVERPPAGGSGVLRDAFTATAWIDGVATPLVGTFESAANPGSATLVFHGDGLHTFEMTLEQSDGGDPVALVLLAFMITGDSRGSAEKCSPCTVGHFCPGGTNRFVPCPVGTEAPHVGFSTCSSCQDGKVAHDEGTAVCRACGEGTVPTPGGDACLNSCSYTAKDGSLYDLTPLRGAVFGPLLPSGFPPTATTAAADSRMVPRFYVSPCSYVNDGANATFCNIRAGRRIENAYVCQRLTANTSFSLGDEVRYSVLHGQLQVTYYGGDQCQSGTPRSTNVTFVCDPNGVQSNGTLGVLRYVNEDPHCHYNFVLTSPSACPLCTEHSFRRTVGVCRNDSTQEVVYAKKNVHDVCRGGWRVPVNETVACNRCRQDYYDTILGKCEGGQQVELHRLRTEHHGCIDDGQLGWPHVTHACSEIDAKLGANKFTLMLFIGLLAVGGTAAALVVLYRRHRVLTQRYDRLASGSGEMNDIVPTTSIYDDDDDNKGSHNAVPAAVTEDL